MYWTTEDQEPTRSTGKNAYFDEPVAHKYLDFAGTFILCPLPPSTNSMRVSITHDRENLGTYADTVELVDLRNRQKIGNISICIQPLHFDYNVGISFVEFIEFYQMLGADQFIFYNYSIEEDDNILLRHYIDQGIIQVLPWTYPLINNKVSKTNYRE